MHIITASLFPIISTKVEISPQNFKTFTFNPFVTLVKNFKALPSAYLKLLNLNQKHPLKKVLKVW